MSGATIITVKLGFSRYKKNENGEWDFAEPAEAKGSWKLKTRQGFVCNDITDDEIEDRAKLMTDEFIQELIMHRDTGALEKIFGDIIKNLRDDAKRKDATEASLTDIKDWP